MNFYVIIIKRTQVQLLHETVKKSKLKLPELVKIQIRFNVHAAQIWQHENQQLNIYDIYFKLLILMLPLHAAA